MSETTQAPELSREERFAKFSSPFGMELQVLMNDFIRRHPGIRAIDITVGLIQTTAGHVAMNRNKQTPDFQIATNLASEIANTYLGANRFALQQEAKEGYAG